MFAEYQWPYRPTLLFLIVFFGYNLPPNTFQAKRMEIKTFVSDILFSYLCFGCALCMANSSNSRVAVQ